MLLGNSFSRSGELAHIRELEIQATQNVNMAFEEFCRAVCNHVEQFANVSSVEIPTTTKNPNTYSTAATSKTIRMH